MAGDDGWPADSLTATAHWQGAARVWRWLDSIAEKRGVLYPWVPVWLSFGIGAWFSWATDPAMEIYAGCAVGALAAIALCCTGGERWRAPSLAVLLLLSGFLLAGARAYSVAGPVLGFRYYGPVEGRIIDIDRSFSDAIRLTLDQVTLKDVALEATPHKVRVALHGPQTLVPVPGMLVMMTANITPPDGPVAPNSFDFQRLAWFSQLGAVGYTRAPVMEAAEPEGSLGLWAFSLRMRLSAAMQAAIPGQAGALSSAFMTGDRSAVTAETNDVMRASNLSHMISISGLHMGLLVGFVFALIRYGVAGVPYLAVRLPAKKIAAVVALGAATFYLLLAGPDVATRRSYIMVVVMLLAVLSERRALTLRTLAVAATIVLVMEPESLVEPGFQMSFGATAALLLSVGPWEKVKDRFHPVIRPVVLMMWTSLVASGATGPIAAAHFNRIAGYGLVANLLANPVIAVLVMPLGVIAAILGPFGLAGLPLWVMGIGTEVILGIAYAVADMPGAITPVVAPAWYVLPILCLGALVAALSSGWLRRVGMLAVAASLVLWSQTVRPDLLISADGQAVGMMTPAGRAMSKPKGAGFVVDAWLQDDGDLADQPTAWLRPAFAGENGLAEASWNGGLLAHLTGKMAADRAVALCEKGQMVVLSGYWQRSRGQTPCDLWDAGRLSATGAVAFYLNGDGVRVVTARQAAGDRMWNQRPKGGKRLRPAGGATAKAAAPRNPRQSRIRPP